MQGRVDGSRYPAFGYGEILVTCKTGRVITPIGEITMRYKLIAADMDGTLLDSNGQIADKTLQTIRRVADAGILFTVCTGRPIQGVDKYNGLLKLKGPAITYNGAVIVDMESRRTLFEQGLLRNDAGKIIELGLEYDTTMCIWSGGRLYGNKLNERIHDYKKLSGVEPVLAENFGELLDQGITKILWYDDEERIRKVLKDFSAELFTEVTCCTSKPDFLEFFNRKASKGKALKKIGELYGIRREEMIAIGDGLNDLDMIRYAGLGIAMGNGDAEVRKQAQFVTDTNDEDGVRKAIERFIGTKGC